MLKTIVTQRFDKMSLFKCPFSVLIFLVNIFSLLECNIFRATNFAMQNAPTRKVGMAVCRQLCIKHNNMPGYNSTGHTYWEKGADMKAEK